MEVTDSLQIPPNSDTAQSTEEKAKTSKPIGDSNVEMDSDDVSTLIVNLISDKDHLQDNDKAKYTGVTKFNPKSFKSGTSVGYINVRESSFELLFAQVKMAMDKMFTVLRLSRFNHLVSKGGLKV